MSQIQVTIRKDKAIKYYKLVCSMAEIFSKDPSTKVAALFLYPDSLQIISMGYNGFPRGINESGSERWERPIKYKYVEHAERNAIYNACFNGVTLKNSICIVTLFPCADCARGIIQSGAKMVVSKKLDMNDEKSSRWKDDWEISMNMFNEAGVGMLFLDNNDLV
jgi:dCMP deaminase